MSGDQPLASFVPATASGPRPPTRLEDAFRAILGAPSVAVLRSIWGDISSRLAGSPETALLRELSTAFLRGMGYSLPEVANCVEDPLQLGLPYQLTDRDFGNVFYRNLNACGVAAIIVHLQSESSDPQSIDLASGSTVVPFYLALNAAASTTVSEPYAQLLQLASTASGGPRPLTEREAAFGRIVEGLRAAMGQAAGDEPRRALKVLLDAIMVVREERVEEHSLTLDLRLPLNCSWALMLHAAAGDNRAKSLVSALARGEQSLRRLLTIRRDELVRELSDLAKHIGRGVGVCSIREGTRAASEGFFRCDGIWPSHRGAPFSLLYDLEWLPPQTDEPPDVRLVLLPNSTVTVLTQGDPLFDYLHGGWRYVDMVAKTRIVSNALYDEESAAQSNHPPLYRIARFAYQLAYHNHGATIDLNLSPEGSSPVEGRLAAMGSRWTIPGLSDDKLLLWEGVDSPGVSTHKGRLAYSLSTHDGMTVWLMADDRNDVIVRDFGHFEKLEPETVSRAWKRYTERKGIPEEPLGGARHRAAFHRALVKSKGRVVLCVSQDGTIDAYMGENWLPLR